MPRPIPRYVEEANIMSGKVKFTWNEEVYHPILYPRGGGAKFFKMAPFAATAYGAACAEWIVHRLLRLTTEEDARDMFHRIDAMWVAAVDATRVRELPSRSFEAPDEDVDGALSTASILMERAVAMTQEPDTLLGLTAFGLAELARHVCPTTKFQNWVKATLPVFSELYPAERNERDVIVTTPPKLPPVREALLGVTAPAELEAARDRLLGSLDHENPYLVV